MNNECKMDNIFDSCFQSALIRNIKMICEEYKFSSVFILGSHIRYTVEDKIESSDMQNPDKVGQYNKDIGLGGSLKVLWQFNQNIRDENIKNLEKCEIKDFGVMLSRPYKIKALLPYAINNRCIVYKCFHCNKYDGIAYKIDQGDKHTAFIGINGIYTPGFDVIFAPLDNNYDVFGVPIDFGVTFSPGQLPTPIIAVFLRLIKEKDGLNHRLGQVGQANRGDLKTFEPLQPDASHDGQGQTLDGRNDDQGQKDEHTCPPKSDFVSKFVKSMITCNKDIDAVIKNRIKKYPISDSQGNQAKKLLLLHMPKRIWAVVMFADIRGFSRISKTLLGNLGATEEYIAKLYKVAIDEFESSRFGYINKFTGDGFMAVFPVLSSEVGGVIKECKRKVLNGIKCPIINTNATGLDHRLGQIGQGSREDPKTSESFQSDAPPDDQEQPFSGRNDDQGHAAQEENLYYTAYKSYEEDNVPGYIIKDAMETALRIARRADIINTTMKSIRLEDEKEDIKMVVGFGLHYSYIFHSEVTSADGEILDFTALGDGVNAASRYGDCGARKWFHDNEGRKNYYYIAMSDICKEKVKNLLYGHESFCPAKHKTKSGEIEYYYYAYEDEM